MSATLSNDDSCAVDLILERGHQLSGGNGGGISPCFTTAPSESVQQRLTRVEQLLHLLDFYTVAEPAPDLVARTLGRCDRAAGFQLPPSSETIGTPVS